MFLSKIDECRRPQNYQTRLLLLLLLLTPTAGALLPLPLLLLPLLPSCCCCCCCPCPCPYCCPCCCCPCCYCCCCGCPRCCPRCCCKRQRVMKIESLSLFNYFVFFSLSESSVDDKNQQRSRGGRRPCRSGRSHRPLCRQLDHGQRERTERRGILWWRQFASSDKWRDKNSFATFHTTSATPD